MTIDYWRLNEVVTQITAAAPDVISPREQISKTSGTLHVTINLTTVLDSDYKGLSNGLHSCQLDTNIHLQFAPGLCKYFFFLP